MALSEPRLITQRGRGRLVLCSHNRYSELSTVAGLARGELVEAPEEILEAARECLRKERGEPSPGSEK